MTIGPEPLLLRETLREKGAGEELLRCSHGAVSFGLSALFSLYFCAVYGLKGSFELLMGLSVFLITETSFATALALVFSGAGDSVVFFLFFYFLCLLCSLLFLLNLSMQCYSLTDNAVVSISSFVACPFFMVLFYLVTKASASVGLLSMFLSVVMFVFLELFIIAGIVVFHCDPEILSSAGNETKEAALEAVRYVASFFGFRRTEVRHKRL